MNEFTYGLLICIGILVVTSLAAYYDKDKNTEQDKAREDKAREDKRVEERVSDHIKCFAETRMLADEGLSKIMKSNFQFSNTIRDINYKLLAVTNQELEEKIIVLEEKIKDLESK